MNFTKNLHDARAQLQKAQNELNAGKRAFTAKWCIDNPDFNCDELLKYIDSHVWKNHSTKTEADFLDYLDQKLKNKETNFALHLQNVTRMENALENQTSNFI